MLSLKCFYWLGVNSVCTLLAAYFKLFFPASIKKLDCRNKLVSPCKRLSKCPSFRFVASKSRGENPQQTVCKFWRLIPFQLHHCKHFLPSCGLPFHFVYGFYFCAKIFEFNRSHLFIFVFISITLKDETRKILLQFVSKYVLPVFL